MAPKDKEYGMSKRLFSDLGQMFASNPIIRTKLVNKNISMRGSAMKVLKDVSTFYMTMMANQSYDRFARYADYCEMESLGELSAALNIYADECTTLDEQGRMIVVKTDDKKIQQILEEFFISTLNVNANLWHWTRNMCKYGDYFMLNNIIEGEGIVNTLMMPVNEVIREEGFNKDNPFAVRYRWQTRGNSDIEPFEISHFRLTGRENFLPYGQSVIEPARRPWRQLILLEDSMLVYRIVRAPERRVFNVEMGAASPEEEPLIIEKFRSNVTQQNIVDGMGRVEQRFNPMDMATDYYLPMRGGMGSKIEMLPGGAFNGDIDDVEYIQKKLIASLHIPRAFLGFEEALCFQGVTRIPLLDGRVLTPPEIEKEIAKGKIIYVYSCTEDGNIKPGKIEWCGKTKIADKLYKITFDNGEIFKCTGNHPLMLKDGTYKEAKDMQPGDSCMPCYKKTFGKNDYVFNLKNQKWQFCRTENYYVSDEDWPTEIPLDVKITSVEIVDYNDWVWDLHVPGYNNFALEAGVFVHNSGKATLAQEDIRWGRTVQRVQRSLVGELTRLAMIHLYSKGITNESDLMNFELSLTNPSNLSILQRMEVWGKKLEVSRAALDSGLPNQWVQEQLFGFTREEFENNKKQRLDDATFEALIEKAKTGEQLQTSNEEEQPVETFEQPDLSGVGTENLYKHTGLGKYEEETGLNYVLHDIIDPLKERREMQLTNRAVLKELTESGSLDKLNHKFTTPKSIICEIVNKQSVCGNGSCSLTESTEPKQFAKFLK